MQGAGGEGDDDFSPEAF